MNGKLSKNVPGQLILSYRKQVHRAKQGQDALVFSGYSHGPLNMLMCCLLGITLLSSSCN